MARVYKRFDYSKSDFYGIRAIIFELNEDSLVEICDYWNLALDYILCNLSFRMFELLIYNYEVMDLISFDY